MKRDALYRKLIDILHGTSQGGWCLFTAGEVYGNILDLVRTILLNLQDLKWKMVPRSTSPQVASLRWFGWTTVLGKFLTMDNLRRHEIIVMD